MNFLSALLDIYSVLHLDPKKTPTEQSQAITNLETTRGTIRISIPCLKRRTQNEGMF
jgi:hypothetical protein